MVAVNYLYYIVDCLCVFFSSYLNVHRFSDTLNLAILYNNEIST